MSETRASLGEKLETLEEKVVSTVTQATEQVSTTVSEATEAVSSTVSMAKEAVDNTVTAVKDTVTGIRDSFDLPEQVRRHPWVAFAGAIAAGYVLEKMCDSMLFPPDDTEHRNGNGKHKQRGQSRSEPNKPMPRWMADAQKPPEPSPLHEEEHAPAAPTGPTIMQSVGQHVNKLKDMAMGALFNVIRGVAVKSVGSDYAEPAAQLVDDVARSLGITPKPQKAYAGHA